MLIIDLVINEVAVGKLAARGISPLEVEQVIANDPLLTTIPSRAYRGASR